MSIKKLPPHIAAQIAAGEVIERPASVIKELLENAIDAKATQLFIDIEEGGLQLIQVRDDGEGIDEIDLPLSVVTHATSKISDINDLFNIHTLGFRGEALASIASVSKLTITSKTDKAKTAYQLMVEGDNQQSILPMAHPKGTSIVVRDLFFNVPVRRKFLKSKRIEFLHIDAVVKRVALSHFDIGITFSHDGKLIYQLPQATEPHTKSARIARLFGRKFLTSAMTIDVIKDGMRLWGWIGAPDFMRSQSDLQFFYINERMVKDKLVLHAVRKVYEPLLYPGRQASFLLFFELDSQLVDVNVHPTKHEVRFASPRDVHDFISSSIHHQLVNWQCDEQETETKTKFPEQSTTKNIPQGVSPPALNKEPVLGNEDFIRLTDDFGLAFICDKQCVFDYKKLYKDYSLSRYVRLDEEGDIPLRPLLVPMVIRLNPKDIKVFPFDLANESGFTITEVGDGALAVRAFPSLFPHLALASLIPSLVNTFDKKIFFSKVASHQELNYDMLTATERRALIGFLTDKIKSNSEASSSFRLLNNSDWETIVNA